MGTSRSDRSKPSLGTLLQKYEYWILGIIILLACVLRLYRFSNPIADWHSFRQADTASVTREYVKHGIDLLRPRYHDLSNIQAGTRVGGADNLEGWRMVEFPFVNAGIAALIRTFPVLPLVETSRFFSILASLGTLLFLYLFTKQHFSSSVAVVSALTFAVLPYSIFYSRVILPEPYQLLFLMLSLWSFSRWLAKEQITWLLLSAFGLSAALLLKPFTVFLGPVYAVLFVFQLLTIKSQMSKVKSVLLLLPYLLIAFLPLLLWRNWIQQFPSGIPASEWLFNSNGIRFRPAWFRWLGYERLTKLFLGYTGVIFVIAAGLPVVQLLKKPSQLFKSHNVPIIKQLSILGASWIGILAYFSIMATGNVQHDYYQNLILPFVSVTVGYGAVELYKLFSKIGKRENGNVTTTTIWNLELISWNFNQVISIVLVSVLYLSMLFFAWQQVKGYFNVNHWEYIEAGAAVDRLTPPDAKVIAPAMGDTVFLFQTNRTGWPIGFEIDKKIANGAEYYVTTSYDDEARELEQRFSTVEKTDTYLILDLQSPLPTTESQ